MRPVRNPLPLGMGRFKIEENSWKRGSWTAKMLDTNQSVCYLRCKGLMKSEITDLQGKVDALREGLRRALATIEDGKSQPRRQKETSFSRDFSAQYRKMSEVIESTDQRNVMAVILPLVRDGELSDGRGTWKFSPITIQYLKHLLESIGEERHELQKT